MSPVLGVLVGAAAGGVIGQALNSDIVDERFVDDVARALKPDSSAIFLQIRAADKSAVVSALRSFRGTLIQTTVSPELEEELERGVSAHQTHPAIIPPGCTTAPMHWALFSRLTRLSLFCQRIDFM